MARSRPCRLSKRAVWNVMQIEEQSDAAGSMPLLLAAELQDHLMSVTNNDLERLQRLLDDAGEALSNHFYSASSLVMTMLSKGEGDPNLARSGRDAALCRRHRPTTDSRDMSTQLIAHRASACAAVSDQLLPTVSSGMDDADGIAVVETTHPLLTDQNMRELSR